MKNQKSTKRALLSSVLSLFLCVAMLVGTTFAWFTDSVTSANNIIKSGNLDVEMYYADGSKAVPADDSSDWKNAQGVAIYTANQLWEPGYTDAKHIKISNEGSLALKYQLAIIPTGEVSILADVIDVYLYEIADTDANATQVATRNDIDASMYVGTLADVISKGIVQGNLNADTDYTTTIVLKMQEDAGNDYQDKSIGDDFTIQLLATQVTAEGDSFNDQYDADAWMPGMQVYNAEDLQAAINAGEDVVLMNDIELTESIVIPAPAASTFSMRSTPAAQIIDLNGKTLNNNNGYVIENQGNIVITGNGTMSGLGCIRSKAGSVIIENGNFYASSRWQNAVYQHTLKAENTEVVINGGNFDATVNAHTNAMFNASENAIITINGGAFKNVAGDLTMFDPYIFTYEKNGKVVINDGTFYGGWRFNADTATTDIYGGNFTVGFDGQSFHANSTHVVTVYAGTFATQTYAKLTEKLSTIVADGYKAIDNGNGTWSVIFPQDSFDSLIDNAQAGDTVEVPAGKYTFPASKLEEGMVLNCAEGTVFEGTSSLNIKGATVIGATFSNVGGQAVSGTINGTFKDCVFVGEETLRWCYTTAGETIVFENCVFKTDFRGIHFDEMNGNVVFKNCEINGFNAYSGTGTMTFEGCTFGCDESKYNGLNIYSNTNIIDCTFNYVSGKTNFIDMEGTGKTLTIKNSTATLDGKNADIVTFIGGSKLDQNAVLVDGDDILNTIKIGTLQELINFANDVNVNGNSYSGKTVVLTADIDLGNMEWTPIGQTGGNGVKTFFCGTFDGKGHTISNLKITNNAYDEGANYAAGLFGFVDAGDATIKNLTIDGATVNGHHWTGVIAGYLTGKITGCTVMNATVNCTHANSDACGDKAGVIVGYVNQGTVTGNTATNCTVTAGRDAGQIAGAAKTTQVYGNTATNVTATAAGDCTGANIRNEEIGRVLG